MSAYLWNTEKFCKKETATYSETVPLTYKDNLKTGCFYKIITAFFAKNSLVAKRFSAFKNVYNFLKGDKNREKCLQVITSIFNLITMLKFRRHWCLVLLWA